MIFLLPFLVLPFLWQWAYLETFISRQKKTERKGGNTKGINRKKERM